jgi:hypothetical protein
MNLGTLAEGKATVLTLLTPNITSKRYPDLYLNPDLRRDYLLDNISLISGCI